MLILVKHAGDVGLVGLKMSFPFLSKTECMSNEIIILGERTKQASKCLSTDNQEVEIVKTSYVPGYFTSSNLYIVCEHVD